MNDESIQFIVHRSSFILPQKEGPVAHLIQVGAGSGGMPVLDMVCRDPRVTRVTLVEPDVYKSHNVERHLFPLAGGQASQNLLSRAG